MTSIDKSVVSSDSWSYFMKQWSNSSQSALYTIPKHMKKQPGTIIPMKPLSVNSSATVNSQDVDSTKHNGIYFPVGTSIQVTFKPESNRYDKLKHAAEQIFKDQLSTKTERDISTAKLAALESNLQAQSNKIEKLRSDKSQLQSLLHMEKATISKLEFENKSLQTILSGLNSQVLSIHENVANVKKDRDSLLQTMEQYQSRIDKIKHLVDKIETEKTNLVNNHKKLQKDYLDVSTKGDELEKEDKRKTESLTLLRLDYSELEKKYIEADDRAQVKTDLSKKLTSQVEELRQKNNRLQDTVSKLDGDLEDERRKFLVSESKQLHYKSIWEEEANCRRGIEKELQQTKLEMGENEAKAANEARFVIQKIDEQEKLICTMSEQLSQKEEEVTLIKNQFVEQTNSYAQLEKHNQEIEYSLNCMIQEKETLSNNLACSKREMISLENIVSDFKKQQEVWTEEKRKCDENLAILRDHVTTLTKELSDYKQNLEKCILEKEKIFQDSLMLTEELSSLKIVNMDTQAKLQNSNQEKEVHNKDVLILREELKSLKELYAINQQQYQILIQEKEIYHSDLQARNCELKTMQSTYSDCKRQLKALKKEKESGNKELLHCREELKSSQNLYIESQNELKIINDKLEAKLLDLNTTKGCMISMKEQLQANNRDEISHMKRKTVDLLQAKEALIQQKTSENTQLVSEKEKLSDSLRLKEMDLDEFKRTNKELQKKIRQSNFLSQQTLDQTETIRNLENKTKDVMNGYEKMKNEFEKCNNEAESLIKRNCELEEHNLQLLEQIEKLRQEKESSVKIDKEDEYLDSIILSRNHSIDCPKLPNNKVELAKLVPIGQGGRQSPGTSKKHSICGQPCRDVVGPTQNISDNNKYHQNTQTPVKSRTSFSGKLKAPKPSIPDERKIVMSTKYPLETTTKLHEKNICKTQSPPKVSTHIFKNVMTRITSPTCELQKRLKPEKISLDESDKMFNDDDNPFAFVG